MMTSILGAGVTGAGSVPGSPAVSSLIRSSWNRCKTRRRSFERTPPLPNASPLALHCTCRGGTDDE